MKPIILDKDIEEIINRFLDYAEKAYMDVYSMAPLDTGFLREHIKVETILNDNTFVGFALTIEDVPYMKHTEEPWINGLNPNEYWFRSFFEKVISEIYQEVIG